MGRKAGFRCCCSSRKRSLHPSFAATRERSPPVIPAAVCHRNSSRCARIAGSSEGQHGFEAGGGPLRLFGLRDDTRAGGPEWLEPRHPVRRKRVEHAERPGGIAPFCHHQRPADPGTDAVGVPDEEILKHRQRVEVQSSRELALDMHQLDCPLHWNRPERRACAA